MERAREYTLSAGPNGTSKRSDTLLESWKQIAAHLDRHVTTVRRWEKHEGLPVRRHVHSALSSVYAYASEIDAWMKTRQPEELLRPSRTEVFLPVTIRRSSVSPPILNHLKRSPVTLLGRKDEIDRLWKLWHAVSAGRQEIAVVAGEVGEGKTRLVSEFASLVASQARILSGAWDREALIPFAPFVSILRWIVRTADHQTLRSVLSGIGGNRELAQLVPEIADDIPSSAVEFPSSAENRRLLMFDAYAQLIIELARDCSILLVFEDLHWADTGSLLFLRHLIRASTEAAVCILLTYRENEPEGGAFGETQLRDLQREFKATRIQIRGLPLQDIHRFVDTWTGQSVTPQLANWIATTTEGNPLFLTEMLIHLEETGCLHNGVSTHELAIPEGIRALIRRRFVRLSPICKTVLTLGAVIGSEFELALLRLVSDVPEGQLLDAMEEALAASLVKEAPGIPGKFAFKHAILSETLYTDTMAVRRALLHHRIGKALEQQYLPEALRLKELAYHFTEGAAHDQEKAIRYAISAGDQARDGLALEAATRYYGMALRTLRGLPSGPNPDGKRVDLHIWIGRIWFQVGQWESAKTEFLAALSLLDPAALEKRCELMVNIAEVLFWLMDVSAMRRFASEAELLANRIGRNDLWADARAWVASAQVADGDVLGGIALDRQTLSRVPGIRSFGLARVPLTLYWAGQTGEAVSRAREAIEGARASSDPAFLLYALQHLGICLSGVGRYDEALLTFDEALTLGRNCGASSLLARAVSMSVAPLFSLGEFARATDRALEARELARQMAFQPPLVSAGIDLLLIRARTHDQGGTEPLLLEIQQAVDMASGWHAWKWRIRLSQARAELALSKGQWNEAIAFADRALEESNLRHRPKYQALALTVRAQARHRLGVRKSVDDARASVEIARRISDPALLSECLNVLISEDGTEDLVYELRQATDSVLLGVTETSLRRSFLSRIEPSVNTLYQNPAHRTCGLRV